MGIGRFAFTPLLPIDAGGIRGNARAGSVARDSELRRIFRRCALDAPALARNRRLCALGIGRRRRHDCSDGYVRIALDMAGLRFAAGVASAFASIGASAWTLVPFGGQRGLRGSVGEYSAASVSACARRRSGTRMPGRPAEQRGQPGSCSADARHWLPSSAGPSDHSRRSAGQDADARTARLRSLGMLVNRVLRRFRVRLHHPRDIHSRRWPAGW